jgi:hypothetical protein
MSLTKRRVEIQGQATFWPKATTSLSKHPNPRAKESSSCSSAAPDDYWQRSGIK